MVVSSKPGCCHPSASCEVSANSPMVLERLSTSHSSSSIGSRMIMFHFIRTHQMLLMVEMNSLRLQVIIEVAMFKLMLVQTSHHLYLFLPICIPCRQGLPLV
ncbi:hypothetical protein V6Z11_D02G172600 [Gossypium hirsutum]